MRDGRGRRATKTTEEEGGEREGDDDNGGGRREEGGDAKTHVRLRLPLLIIRLLLTRILLRLPQALPLIKY